MERHGAYVDEYGAAIVALFLCPFGPPYRALVADHLKRGGMPLHDALALNCKRALLLKSRHRHKVYSQRGECWVIVRAISDLI